jgi:putative hydrolase of the HAD superfamily
MTRVVIFDVDDTLYLERDYVRSGFAAVARHVEGRYGISGFGERAWRLFEEGHRGRIFDEALRALAGEPRGIDVRELVEVYRGHEPSIELLPDAATTLNDLRNRGVTVGVITDGPAESQRAKVSTLQLERYAAIVVVTDELGPGKGKPHEAAFRRVQDELGVGGIEASYVADNPVKDFIAPNRLGWRTVRIRREYGLHRRVAGHGDIDVEAATLTPAVCVAPPTS